MEIILDPFCRPNRTEKGKVGSQRSRQGVLYVGERVDNGVPSPWCCTDDPRPPRSTPTPASRWERGEMRPNNSETVPYTRSVPKVMRTSSAFIVMTVK